jgi:hypothetical protein
MMDAVDRTHHRKKTDFTELAIQKLKSDPAAWKYGHQNVQAFEQGQRATC